MATSPFRKSEIVSGAFVLAAALTFALFAFQLGGLGNLEWLGGPRVMCTTTFPNVKNLTIGAKVTSAGQRVGGVTGIRLVEREVAPGVARQVAEVEFKLTDPTLRIDFDQAHVELKQDGFLGQHFISIESEPWTDAPPAPLFEAGLTEPVAMSSVASADMDALVANASSALQSVDQILTDFSAALQTENDENALEQALANANRILTSVRELFDESTAGNVYERVLEPIQNLVANADTTITRLRQRVLEQTLERADSLLESGQRLAGDARQALDKANQLLDSAEPRLRTTLDNLAAATTDLDQRIDRIEHEITAVLTATGGVVTENRAGLAETVRRLRRTMWAAEMALRKIRANPAYLLFGDDEPDLDARPFDPTDLRRSGRARPFGQRDEGNGGK